jgi:hypothetical protein
MKKDQLFLLMPAFDDDTQPGGPFHCEDCAQIEGLLSYFPRLRDTIDVHYVPFSRPRQPLIDLLGNEHQNCPMIVVGEDTVVSSPVLATSAATGRRFCTAVKDVTQYLMAAHGVSAPHP